MYRNILYVCMFLVTICSIAVASTTDTALHTLLDSHARIISEYESESSVMPAVIFVQDYHAHSAVQKNIAALIDSAVEQYGADNVLVCAEGADAGEIDTSVLSWFPDADQAAQVLTALLESGKVSGAEYVHALRASQQGETFSLYGVEDSQLYQENLELYFEAHGNQEDLSDILAELHDGFHAVVMSHFNTDLQYVVTHIGLETEGDALQEHLLSLVGYAVKYGIAIAEFKAGGWLNKLYELDRSLGSINFALVNADADALVKSLKAKGITVPKSDDLMTYVSLAREHKVQLDDYIELRKYVSFNDTFNAMDFKAVIEEKVDLEKVLLGRMARSALEKRIIAGVYYVKSLEKLVELEMTADEEPFVDRALEKARDMYTLLNSLLPSAARVTDVDDKLARIKDAYMARIFYDVAKERDRIIVDNVRAAYAARPSVAVVILVAGGYHADGIEAELKSHAISYVSVRPHIPTDDADVKEKYIQALEGHMDPEVRVLYETITESVYKK